MIEKHQQTNGIGRGKITINPEYIKRAGEITVEGLPVKILSSNPNTGRVLAQFPDGHTEEVKAAPDYFIGGNTSTKELKNNLPIYGETNTAANERADSLDEAHDLTPIFANLMTAGQAPVVNEGAENIKKGNYLLGASLIASPLMFGSGAVGTAARSGVGLYNLANENGVRKTINNFSEGNYGQGALSLLGDAFNAAMATEGLGSMSNALKGTTGYRNWRLARKINLAIKNNKPNIEVPNPTKYNISDNITLYRANPTNIKNPSYKGERYGDTSGLYVGKWFTDESSKPNWFASNMAKGGEEPAYYQVTVPRYWAELQKASKQISNPRIEFEPEDYIIEDGILGLPGQLYQGRPGTIQYLQQSFKTPKLSEPLTSLKFFERPQSKISEAERLGIPKGDRNFKPKWHVANYPGYLLKGLMKGSLLERLLSKNGTININLLNAYFNKASQIEKEVANKVLSEKFAGLKTIDYNLFKKAVLDELINYSTKPQTKYLDYGMDRLGYKSNRHIWEMDQDPNIRFDDGLPVHVDTGIPLTLEERVAWLNQDLPRLNTFTFESPRISIGNNKHYDATTLGHSRTFTLPEDPHTLYVMESLSDWAQNFKHQHGVESMHDAPPHPLFGNINSTTYVPPLHQYLANNYLQRQLQENLRYAAENGLTKMRYPTSETAAKIEGYLKGVIRQEDLIKYNALEDAIRTLKLPNSTVKDLDNFGIFPIRYPENATKEELIEFFENELASIKPQYSPKHQTILKKYADFPKLFLKLFKDLKVGTVSDTKGNTWYEVDVPKGYLSREWLFKQGGKMNIIELFKKGNKIYIKPKNRGKFTKYCHGKVTDECIRRAKASGNPTLIKRATFADNARKWKHKEGGKAFVKGVNVLDSNPRIYKYLTKIKVSPRGVVKKETGGSFVNNALNFINSDTGQSIIGGVSNIIQGMSAKKKLNKAIDALKKAIDELYNVAKNNIDMGAIKSLAQANLELKMALSPGIHFGEIDLGYEENKLKLEAAAKATNDANVLRDQALANLNNQASLMSNEVSNNITGNIGGLLNGAFQLAGNYFSNKTSSNSTTVKPGYTYSKIASNNFSVPKTNFSVNMKL